jgi:hypothetical protein
MYEYCAGKHWILYWIQENPTDSVSTTTTTTTTEQGTSTWHLTSTKETTTIGMSMHA